MRNNIRRLMICVYFLSCFILINMNSVYAQWEEVLIDTSIHCEEEGGSIPIAGDLEDDGDMDILVSYVTNSSIPLGMQTWYRSPGWRKQVIADNIGGMKVVDINNDNKNDIVAADYLDGEVIWYEAPSWDKHLIGNLQHAFFLNVFDLDQDGDMDVIVLQSEPGAGYLYWYEAPFWPVHPIGTCPNDALFIVTADVDQNNYTDVLLSSQSGIFLFKAPNWDREVITDTTVTGIYQSSQIDVGDIDNDGDIDVVYSNQKANMVSWYENPSWNQHIIDPNLKDASGVALAHLDKDGYLDVVATGNGTREVVWYESPFWLKHVIDDSFDRPLYLCVHEITGDNNPDVVVGSDNGHVALYKSMMTGVKSNFTASGIPISIKLHQNYPNPFNPSMTIKYQLGKASHVVLTIYNLAGQKITTLIDAFQSAGDHEVTWQSEGLPSGLYFYRLEAGDFSETKKIILQK